MYIFSLITEPSPMIVSLNIMTNYVNHLYYVVHSQNIYSTLYKILYYNTSLISININVVL